MCLKMFEGQREVWKKIPEKDTTHYKFENRQQEKLRFKSGLSNLRYLKYSSQEEGTRKKMVLFDFKSPFFHSKVSPVMHGSYK